VTAREADPTDPGNFPEHADIVVVAGPDPDRNLATARAARATYPEAVLIAFAGAEPGATAGGADRAEPDGTAAAALATVANRVIDPTAALAERVLDAAGGPPGRRAADLLSTLRRTEPPLAVVAHDNPDPDAIASALALARLAESVGLSAAPGPSGSVSPQENRAFVNLLDVSLASLEGADLDDYGGIALVDHSRPGVNDSLPPETPVDVVIDHHPPGGPVEGRFVDVRPDAGATSSMLVGYLRRLGSDDRGNGNGNGNGGGTGTGTGSGSGSGSGVVSGADGGWVDGGLATALLFGIRVDTRGFTREMSPLDFEAAGELAPRADWDLLDRIGAPSVTAGTLETVGRAISRRDVHGSALSACVGEITDRDALAQAADLLLGMEGVRIALVYGYVDGVIYCSGRARGTDVDLGEVLRRALDRIGSAGGHADMAGAQVPMGILKGIDRGDERLADVVRDVISARFHAALADAPSTPALDPSGLATIDGRSEGGEDEDADGDGSGSEDVDAGTGDANPAVAVADERWMPTRDGGENGTAGTESGGGEGPGTGSEVGNERGDGNGNENADGEGG
jgi:nanoRNase/pAp phosphatase (c-di-AMP/oligoRNAs hydrolase)